MSKLLPIAQASDIPAQYQDTPIGHLLEYQNLDRPFETIEKAELLIGMCMDYRKHLRIPDYFAFIIRSGGANLRYSEFKVSFAIAVGGVRHIALIGHTQCGMVNIASRKDQIVQGLVDGAGWSAEQAEEHFNQFGPMFEIGNEVDFVLSEAVRLRKRYPKIPVAPLLYKVEDAALYVINED